MAFLQNIKSQLPENDPAQFRPPFAGLHYGGGVPGPEAGGYGGYDAGMSMVGLPMMNSLPAGGPGSQLMGAMGMPMGPPGIVPSQGLMMAAAAPAPGVGAAAAAAQADAAGKKRTRKAPDRNAPKRALTSYFLFMQNNKPQIKEAHSDWSAQQISEESERRWSQISPSEKQVRDNALGVDFPTYTAAFARGIRFVTIWATLRFLLSFHWLRVEDGLL